MLKRILLYFLFAFCLLSKEGISWIIDSIQLKQSVYSLKDKSTERAAEEEDVSEDIWHYAASGMEDFSILPVELSIQKVPNSIEESHLQVHLERIIPPPDKAWLFRLIETKS